MSFIKRFDHVGITVADLNAVTAFFVSLGLDADQKMTVEGEFLDTVIGMTNARTEIVMPRSRATAWWEASANMKVCGGWPTSAGPKESSSHWPSASRSKETS